MCSGRQSRPHLFHVVRKVCTKSGHVSTIPPVVKNNSHHGISTIKSDYPRNVCFSIAAKWDGKDWRDARFGVRLDLTNYKVSYTGPAPEAQKEVEPGRNG